MVERNLHVTLKSEDSKPSAFWDRHFTALLTLVGVLLAAVLAISDNALKIFVNQPPEVEIFLTKNTVSKGETIIAKAKLSDPDGSHAETQYKWEILELATEIKDGIGEKNDRIILPTTHLGVHTIWLTVTDKKGRGKLGENTAQFTVTDVTENTKETKAETNTSTDKEDAIILSSDTEIDWSEQQASVIVTNGHDLLLTADVIASNLSIVSFNDNAKDGPSGDPGISGANGAFMQAGTDGGNGTPGENGDDGRNAGKLTIIISGSLNAELSIENNGQNGGEGGLGGKGAPGGSGGQGRPAVTGIFDCRSGPGRGARGGDGGKGGRGGNGGNGGNAGEVLLSINGFGASAQLIVSADGGKPGQFGVGGQGGFAGSGGREGNTSGLCSSASRQGNNGSLGTDGSSGDAGIAGVPANIELKLKDKTINEISNFNYPNNSD